MNIPLRVCRSFLPFSSSFFVFVWWSFGLATANRVGLASQLIVEDFHLAFTLFVAEDASPPFT